MRRSTRLLKLACFAWGLLASAFAGLARETGAPVQLVAPRAGATLAAGSTAEHPRTVQATLGVEREIGNHWFLSVDGVHANTTDIPRNLDLNAPSEFVRTAPGQTRPATVADATRPITPTPTATAASW